MPSHDAFPEEPEIAEAIPCGDPESYANSLIETEGFRLFSVFPADEPRKVLVEKEGRFLALERSGHPAGSSSGVPSREFPDDGAWHAGRAGMQYRDLIPGRLDGRLIASHIRVPSGGPVPDYVHFHNIDFQVICCLRGWCDLVYENQGPPFRFEAGDYVLQPPGIRHRVLKCSDGFEVIELSSPAEHPTYAEHGFDLPNGRTVPEREFSGQRFVHTNCREGRRESPAPGLELVRTRLEEASLGKVDLSVVRATGRFRGPAALTVEGPAFVFVRTGRFAIASGDRVAELSDHDSFFITAGTPWIRTASPEAELLLFRFGSFADPARGK